MTTLRYLLGVDLLLLHWKSGPSSARALCKLGRVGLPNCWRLLMVKWACLGLIWVNGLLGRCGRLVKALNLVQALVWALVWVENMLGWALGLGVVRLLRVELIIHALLLGWAESRP